MRKLINLAVFLLVANAVYQVAPVYVHYFTFKDALGELALFSQKSTDEEIVDRVMALADENKIPLLREYVVVRHQAGMIHIDATYVDTFHYLPGFEYPWQFDASAKSFDKQGALR